MHFSTPWNWEQQYELKLLSSIMWESNTRYEIILCLLLLLTNKNSFDLLFFFYFKKIFDEINTKRYEHNKKQKQFLVNTTKLIKSQ